MGKYENYKWFYENTLIRPYLPDTALCDEDTLTSYLAQYHMVYLKPEDGGQGIGIVKAWREDGRYGYIIERGDPEYCAAPSELYNRLFANAVPFTWKPVTNTTYDTPYIVQRGIHLAQIRGRPFDIRLMMMRDAAEKWNYAGMLAKVAREKSIVTNISKGGYVLSVDDALYRSLGISGEKAIRMKNEIIRLGFMCNEVYSRHMYLPEIGYDIAIDQSGKIWIIEANIGPGRKIFTLLKDKTMYRKIVKLYHEYRNRKRSGPSKV